MRRCGMAGLILLNGRVFTARSGEPAFDGGVAIAGDRIVAVGGASALRVVAPPDAKEIDVEGRSILPGFVDAHHHLAFTGAELAAIDARYPGVAPSRIWWPASPKRRSARLMAHGSARSG